MNAIVATLSIYFIPILIGFIILAIFLGFVFYAKSKKKTDETPKQSLTN